VTAPAEAPLPGYVCVVAKPHVVEPFELDRDDGHAYWDAAMDVARAVRTVMGARKVNYEIHGNTLPHLHLHLYPRYAGDPFEGRLIDGRSTAFHRDEADLGVLRAAIAAGRRHA
jgi:diadenosine tetraphosphate (Ap4A) HIT family hydrolase